MTWTVPKTGEPETFDFGDGLQMTLRPLTTPTRLAVEGRVAAVMRSLMGNAGVLEDLGFDSGQFGMLADGHILMGVSSFVAALAYGEALIADWTVGDANGVRIEPSPDAIRAVLHGTAGGRGVYDTLIRIVDGDKSSRLAEGEGSASPPNGSGAAGRNTAGAVERSTRAGTDAPPARSSRTRRKPSPASPPGGPGSATASGNAPG